MLEPSEIKINRYYDSPYEPLTVTCSYEEGLSNIMLIIGIASIVALISVIVSLIIGIRKKDCLAIFVANVMVKTVAMFMLQIDWLNNFLTKFILLFILTIVIEGAIYMKVLKYKKQNGMTVSIISNICIILMVLMYKYRVWEWSDLPFFEVRSNFYREKIR